jgi:hypothetical protein
MQQREKQVEAIHRELGGMRPARQAGGLLQAGDVGCRAALRQILQPGGNRLLVGLTFFRQQCDAGNQNPPPPARRR